MIAAGRKKELNPVDCSARFHRHALRVERFAVQVIKNDRLSASSGKAEAVNAVGFDHKKIVVTPLEAQVIISEEKLLGFGRFWSGRGICRTTESF